MSNKYIVIIGGGTLQLESIKQSLILGYKVIVVDGSPLSLGLKIADIPVLISTHNDEDVFKKILSLSKKHSIHAVFTAGTDKSVIVAKISNALNLPGISVESAYRATNKYLMRQALVKANIPTPLFLQTSSVDDAIDFFNTLKTPQAVIKPIDSMGARGVKKIFCAVDILSAFSHTASFSSDKTVLIEELLEGDELSIDSIIFNNRFVPLGIADRIIQHDPYFIETGHILPSQKNQSIQEQACDMLQEGAKALGITYGVAKGDIKITPEGPRIIEIAARLSGGFMSSHTFPYSTGINLHQIAIKMALGQNPTQGDLIPHQHYFSIEKGLIAPHSGTYKKIQKLTEASEIPFIKNIFITANPHQKVHSITSNVDKLGHIIATAPTLEKAQQAIDQAIQTLNIIMEPK